MPTSPLIAVLCGAANPPSRAPLEAAAEAVGARMAWLDPHGIGDVVDLPELPAVVIARSGGFTDDTALGAIRRFEAAGIPCLPPSHRVEVVRDKLLAACVLAEAGIPVPLSVTPDAFAANAAARTADATALTFPLVVKTRCGMRGNGVVLVRDRSELARALAAVPAETGLADLSPLLIQQYVGDGTGADVRVMVVAGRVLGVIKRTPADGEFRANAHQGARVEMFEPSRGLERVACAAATALGLAVAGVDLVLDAPMSGELDSPISERWLVLEVNSSPGFESFEAATGIDVAAAIVAEALRHIGARP